MNCFDPVIVSVPLRCTTFASAEVTNCWVASCPDAVEVPSTVRTCAMLSGELVPTDQFSVFTVASLS